ncbi:MAG: hypothetical protein HN488_11105 [Saprospiraceae bacterium]|jgi:hypothetical protein|nr:hypothetical protein [Saprospiraceae bacterium]
MAKSYFGDWKRCCNRWLSRYLSKVFGYDEFNALDGSIMPTSLEPNPAGILIAFTERIIEEVV